MRSINLRVIPGYEGVYWMDDRGRVYNKQFHRIKPVHTSTGKFIELRNRGQRERIKLETLLELMENQYEDS